MKNPFDSYRIMEFEDSSPIRDFKTIRVFTRGEEFIKILVAEAAPDRWAFGVSAHLMDGNTYTQLPDLAYGHAENENAAILYIAGNLLTQKQRFSKDAVAAIYDCIKKYRTKSIFF